MRSCVFLLAISWSDLFDFLKTRNTTTFITVCSMGHQKQNDTKGTNSYIKKLT